MNKKKHLNHSKIQPHIFEKYLNDFQKETHDLKRSCNIPDLVGDCNSEYLLLRLIFNNQLRKVTVNFDLLPIQIICHFLKPFGASGFRK